MVWTRVRKFGFRVKICQISGVSVTKETAKLLHSITSSQLWQWRMPLRIWMMHATHLKTFKVTKCPLASYWCLMISLKSTLGIWWSKVNEFSERRVPGYLQVMVNWNWMKQIPCSVASWFTYDKHSLHMNLQKNVRLLYQMNSWSYINTCGNLSLSLCIFTIHMHLWANLEINIIKT